MTITFTNSIKEVSFVIDKSDMDKKIAERMIEDALKVVPDASLVIFWEKASIIQIKDITAKLFISIINRKDKFKML